MQYIDNGEVLFARTVRKAKEIIDMLERDDSAAIILSTDKPHILAPGLTDKKETLLKALDTVSCSYSEGDPGGAFARASDLLVTAGMPNREVYYLTDGAVNALPDTINLSKTVRLYTLLVGPEKRDGPVLENLDIIDRLVTAGKTVTFRAQGYAGETEEDVTIELYVNGERKSRTLAEKRSAGKIEAAFEYVPETPGWYSVYASVGDGRFEPGEQRHLVMHVPEKVQVLLVVDSSGDHYFLNKALEPDNETSMFSVRAVQSNALKPEHVSFADVIVLSGITTFSEQSYYSIRSAVVEGGAGIIVFPDEVMDSSLYTNGIFRDIVPLTVEKHVSFNDDKGSGFTMIDWFDMSHPILSDVSVSGDFEKPAVRSYNVLRPEESVTVLARFSDGSMAIGETPCGSGKAVVFGVDATSVASDFPLTGVFVPLFLRTIQYLSGAFVKGSSYDCGETVREAVEVNRQSSPVTLKPEDGPARLVQLHYSESGTLLDDVTAEKPGFYSVFTGTNERKRFSVDISRPEALLKRAGETTMEETFKQVSWKALDDNDNILTFVTKDRYGTELFSMFLALALVAVIIEMGISRKL